MGEFIGRETGVAAEGVDRLGHSAWCFAEDFFAIHFRIANEILREDFVQFLAFALFIQLLYLHIDLRHLYGVFAQRGLVEERWPLVGVGTVDEVGDFSFVVIIIAFQQVGGGA